jgi:NAD(P)-dependent dehydrogenase (short-subunit alcohol dehydrogenase family)
MSKPTAVVVGVGAERGPGAALCRRFAQGGYHVLVAGRTQAKIGRVAEIIAAAGGSAEPIAMDATRESDVAGLFERAMAPGDGLDPTELVVSNAGNNQRIDFRELTSEQFEDFWRVGCFSGFLVGREAARRLVPLGRGSIIFTGASASIRGKPGFAHFAAAKAGLRMVAQSMAREYGPLGIHVAHVVIDGGIDGERLRKRAPTLSRNVGRTVSSISTRSRKLIGRFIANRVLHGRKKSTCVRSRNRSEWRRASLRSASSRLRCCPSRPLMVARALAAKPRVRSNFSAVRRPLSHSHSSQCPCSTASAKPSRSIRSG